MRNFVLAAAAAALFLPQALAAPKPGFDCAKAATEEEKLICADAALAGRDAELSAVYGRIIAANPAYAAGLRDGQRSFNANRSQCRSGGRDSRIGCLKQQYQNRLAALQGQTLLACAKPELTGNAFALRCIAPNHPLKLSLTLAGTKADMDAALTKLTVAKAGSAPQVLKLDGQIFFDGVSTALELMDVNFDGFADIKLAIATSAGPNMSYDYWLFSPKTNAFAATKLGDQLSGFDISTDAKSRTIAVTGRSSCCSWNTSVYGWKGAALVLRTSEDSGEFSALDLPGGEELDGQFCGRETRHFNDAGLITRIDVATGPGGDYECSPEALKSGSRVLAAMKRNPKGYRIEMAKLPGAFSVIFDTPKKPAY